MGIENRIVSAVLKDAKSNLRKTVKKAKQKYYWKVIDGLDHQHIFQAIKWSPTARQYTMSPIQQQNSSLAIDNQEKQKALRDKLLTRPANTYQENIEVPNV